ncbi:MAG: DUF4157 domain-containing protein [Deltaproteobacteria bacterium]|nr:DUF4157 domain-containing protein [Deltaproteobacteria bacterium]MCB9788801.1 DUF4157 domain-containing protein [Deltaproteobacteria bacterium]
MAADDDLTPDELAARGLEAIEAAAEDPDRAAELEALARQVEAPGLQDRILERYASFGRELLSDTLPSALDPRIARHLEPLLGDVSGVRVHTGKLATEAAHAMQARAFAIGDADIFIADQHYDPSSPRGAALLAHEVAHTRDAATGFAMSGELGVGSDREQFAEAIAERLSLELAREDIGERDAFYDELGASTVLREYDAASIDPATIDRFDLEERIWRILEQQGRREQDRQGR